MTIHLNSHWGGVLTKLLRDFLETEVDEEFYKNDARTQALIDKLIADGYQPTNTHDVEQVGNFIHTGNFSNPQRGRVYDANALSPSLNTCGGGGQEVKIIVAQRGRGEPLETDSKINIVGTLSEHNGGWVLSPDGISTTLLSRDYKGPVKIVEGQTDE